MLFGLAGLLAIGVSFCDVWSAYSSPSPDTAIPGGPALAGTPASAPAANSTTANATLVGLMVPPSYPGMTLAIRGSRSRSRAWLGSRHGSGNGWVGSATRYLALGCWCTARRSGSAEIAQCVCAQHAKRSTDVVS